MTVEQGALWHPPVGEIIVVQTDVPRLGREGKDVAQWMIRLTEPGVPERALYTTLPSVTLTGNIEHAKLAGGLTAQAERQRDSINRLLDHLKQHCPGLNGFSQCPHLAS